MVYISSKSDVFEFSSGQKSPIRGVACDLRCLFSNLAELFQLKVMCENLVPIGWAFQELSYEFSGGGWGEPPIKGATCDLRCPFSNFPEIFQSKVMCENLVGIGWDFQDYRVHKHFSWGSETPNQGSYIWPVMPIFELGCTIPVKSHVKKFGLDWLKSEVW